MTETDTGYAPERWAFDEEVTRVFDDMLRRSIPQYDLMRESVFDVGSRFVRDKTAVIDLGCSRGEALAPLVARFGARARYVGVDVSKPMLAATRERFAGYISSGIVEVRDLDLRREYPATSGVSLTLAVLTLQFVPIEYRQQVVGNIAASTVEGGALVLVEKVLGNAPLTDRILREEYETSKRRNGYTEEEVERKKLSLEGVLVPVTADWNEDMLRASGFRTVECFWRWFNFAAWVAVK